MNTSLIRQQVGTIVLAALAIVLLAGPSGVDAFSFNGSTHHPRLFITTDDIPVISARVGISDTPEPAVMLRGWRSHMDEWGRVLDIVEDAPTELELPGTGSTGSWNKNDARHVGEYLSNIAVVYLLNQGRDLGDQMRTRLKSYMEDIVLDARSRNGGAIGASIAANDWGKNAVYKGFCMAYDYMYATLSQTDPDLLENYGRWIYKQGIAGYDDCNYAGEDITNYKHYYKLPWIMDGAVAAFLTIWEDIPALQNDIEDKMDYCIEFKWEDYRVREQNFVGTYSGYRAERVEEDLITATLIKDCISGHDPFSEFPNHFLNIDDWVMYMLRADLGESDETGDATDLGNISHYFYSYPYISANYNNDNQTLYFLDSLWDHLGTDALQLLAEPWVLIFWNDKTTNRKSPAFTDAPLSRYFGDLTWEDGGNSQYTHFRSNWAIGRDETTIVASFLCGPIAGGHDAYSNGHYAVFRGGDILTASTGVYDGTAFDHCRNYYQPPISENSILIYQPNSPYVAETDHYESWPHREGMMAPPPGSTGGGGVYMAADPYDDKHEMGHVTKFACTMGAGRQVSRLECDLTDGYPNTAKPTIWTQGAVADKVVRDFMFLAGKYFIVYDRLYATSSSWKKSVIIHSPDQAMPRLIDGTWSGGVQPHSCLHGGTPGVWTQDGSRFYWEKGDSRCFITAHLPAVESGRRILAIGGANSQGIWNRSGSDPSYEFWLRRTGQNYAWSSQYMNPGEIEQQVSSGWAGWWRLEMEPVQDSREDRFLVLLEPAPKGQSQPTGSARIPCDPQAVSLQIEDSVEPIVVTLPLGLDPLEDVWYDYGPQGSLLDGIGAESETELWSQHVVDGLAPGDYVVLLEVPGGRSDIEMVHQGATTPDGLLTFHARGAGRFNVMPLDSPLVEQFLDELPLRVEVQR